MVLRNARVLIVEDEALLRMDLQDMLVDLGCQVAGCAANLESGLQMATSITDIDLAILDVNLAGDFAYPIADLLARREIPFVFATGYGESGIPVNHRAAGVLEKPYDVAGLSATLARVVG